MVKPSRRIDFITWNRWRIGAPLRWMQERLSTHVASMANTAAKSCCCCYPPHKLISMILCCSTNEELSICFAMHQNPFHYWETSILDPNTFSWWYSYMLVCSFDIHTKHTCKGTQHLAIWQTQRTRWQWWGEQQHWGKRWFVYTKCDGRKHPICTSWHQNKKPLPRCNPRVCDVAQGGTAMTNW